jgi:glycosyltransferase involved in cell wall biosynthesis
MRLALVSTWDTVCGIAFYTHQYMETMRRHGVKVKVFSEKDLPNVPNIPTPKTIPFEKAWSRYDGDWLEMARKIIGWKADVVLIIHEAGMFGTDTRMKQLVRTLQQAGIKVFIDIQCPDLKGYYESLDANGYICTTCPSEAYVPRGRTLVIPLPVRVYPEMSKEETRQVLGIPRDVKMGLVTGFLRAATGIPEIVSAWKGVVQAYPTARLYFAGGIHPFDTDYWLQQGKELVKQLSLENNVFFTERIHTDEELMLFGAATDVFLNYRLRSNPAIVGGAIMRAISSRRPAIVYDCAPVAILNKGVIRVRSIEEMTQAIVKVFSDPVLEEQLTNEMRELYAERNWEVIVPKIIKFMEETP